MDNGDELDFACLGFDVEHPGQFLFQQGETTTLRICHTRPRLPLLARRMSTKLDMVPSVFLDPKRPTLAMVEWKLSPEQVEQARLMLKPLRVTEVTMIS